MPPRRTLDQTRDLLLRAGMELLSERGLQVSVDHIALIDVCRRAGLTTAGSAYKIWPTQKAFRAALLQSLYETTTITDVTVPAALALLDELPRTHEGLLELIRRSAAVEAEGLIGNPLYTTYLAMWSAAGSEPELAARIRDADRALLGMLTGFYEAMAKEFGLEWVEPFDAEMFTMAVAGLVEGLAIRGRYDPGAVPADIRRPTGPGGAEQSWHLFACATEALVAAWLRPSS